MTNKTDLQSSIEIINAPTILNFNSYIKLSSRSR